MRVRKILLLLLCCLLSGAAVTNASESIERYRIVFSTFDVASAGEYSYLRDGVQSMLASRLAAKDSVDVLDQRLSEKELQKITAEDFGGGGPKSVLNADYLVTGALFSLTTGVNLQVVMYPLSPDKETLNFSVLSSHIEKLLPGVEKLAEDIAAQAFGYSTVAGTSRKKQTFGDSGFVTVHPEAAYKKGLYSGTVIGVDGGLIKTSAVGVRRRATIEGEMKAMVVGDINNDTEDNIVIVTERHVIIYAVAGRKLVEIAKTGLPPKMRVHAVNLADTNGDGKNDLYLSGTSGLDVSSFIMSWDSATGFRTKAQHIPWYLRPVFVPEKGWIISGQRRGINKADFIAPGVYQLTFDEGGKVIKGDQIALPKSVNLFDFTYADLDGDGSFELAAIDPNEKLKIFNHVNQLMWVSTQKFGGSKVVLGPSVGGATDERSKSGFTTNDDWDRQPVHVPGRILTADIDLDGKQEIVVGQMKSSGFGFFKRLRPYSGGSVVGLSWDGASMSEVWRTGRFEGYVAGYDFVLFEDMEIPGTESKRKGTSKSVARLYVGNIPTSGTLAALLPGVVKTEFSVYDLGFERIEAE